jgi:transposase
MGYIEGTNRKQNVMFPSTIDEYIAETNEVRAIEAFIGALNFKELKFDRAEPAETGRPGYDPRKMMGLYMWGNMNRLRSSRKLERECERNLEVMWLMEGQKPDFKTISDFRKDNGDAIKQTVVKFRVWGMDAGLFGKELVAVDGSKFKAVNSKDRNYTKNILKKRIEQEKEKVAKYLEEMEETDKAEDEAERGKEKLNKEGLNQKLDRIQGYLEKQEKLLKEMEETGETQISKTDEESRLMKTNGGMDVCYNVQTVVDSKHKLIVDYKITNKCNDVDQLAEMAKKAKEALGVDELTVVADGGYYEGNNVKECEEEGITVYVPVLEPTTADDKGVFRQERFAYDKERNVYVCPQGEELVRRTREIRQGKEYSVYRTKACGTCPLRARCTTSKKTGRTIRRWVHHEVIDRLAERNRLNPEMMSNRKKLVEHPYGTLKRAMDAGYFLMKGKVKVGIEMGLSVLAYNMKRVINIMGVEGMVKSMGQTSALAG